MGGFLHPSNLTRSSQLPSRAALAVEVQVEVPLGCH